MRNPQAATSAELRPDDSPWRGRHRPADSFDGWSGTPESPGYRAGEIVVRLSHLPHVAPRHLYLDVLLLDSSGRTREAQGGVCFSLPVDAPLDARARFVCIVAELLRHAAADACRFSAIAQALAVLRELGVERGPLIAAAQLLDVACAESAVVDSLVDLLVASLGEDEAQRTLGEILDRIGRTRPGHEELRSMQSASLAEQTAQLVRALGKHRVRHYLRAATDFDLVPKLEMFRA